MIFSLSRRTYAAIAGVSLGALALAGCGTDGDEPDASPTPTAEPDVAAPQEPDVNDFGGSEPDPTATGVTRVESLEGSLAADIPNSWGEFPPETGEQAQADPEVTDVLGFWVAGADVEAQHSVVIMGQLPEEPAVDAQEYWELYFADVEEPGVTVDYDISESDEGREILFVDATADLEEGLVADSLFFVFAEDQMVVGLMSSPGEMDQEYRDLLRDVAQSMEVL